MNLLKITKRVGFVFATGVLLFGSILAIPRTRGRILAAIGMTSDRVTHYLHTQTVTAQCEGRDDTPALRAAASGAKGGWVIISSGRTCVADDLTIPKLRIENGGILQPANGHTVTISENFEAGSYQVFANALQGQGRISFAGSTPMREFNPIWWGASAGGVVDARAAIQAANDAMPAAGGILLLDSGVFSIAGPINLGQFVILHGTGYQGTEIRALRSFRGAAMIQNKFQDGTQQMVAVENVLVNGNKEEGAKVPIGILLKIVGQLSHIRDVYITNCSGSGLVLNGGSPSEGNHFGSAGYYLNNISVDASNEHNIIITGQIQSVTMDTVTSQFMASGKTGIYLDGTGIEGKTGIWMRNIHLEGNPSREQMDVVGIDINNMNSVLIDGANYIGANAKTGDMVRIRGTANDITLHGLRSQSLLNIINDTVNKRTLPTASFPFVAYYSTGDLYARNVSAGGLRIGEGTVLTKFMVYTPFLTPARLSPNSSGEQDFPVAGIEVSDKIIVNGPAMSPGTGIVNARVKSPNVVSLTFANVSGQFLSPPSGIYNIIAIRN